MALLFAFSIQEQVEKYGAYVGLAAFLGLAVLTVLYFAQARELKRLRDWAGRAPERAQEVEARVVAQAEELRRAEPEAAPAAERSGTVGPAQPVAKPATAAAAPSGNGRGTGTPAPIPPGPRPAVAIAAAAAQAAAVATEDKPEAETESAPESPETVVAAAVETPAGPPTEAHPAPVPDDDEPSEEGPSEDGAKPDTAPAAEPASGGNGVATPPPEIPRATPRPPPQPQPDARPAPAMPVRAAGSVGRTATVPPRRGTTTAPRRDNGGSSRAGRITAITLGGIVAVGLIAFGATQLLGGSDEPKPPANVAETPNPTPSGGGNAGTDVADQRPDTVVAVLNGTATDGLAGSIRDKLIAEGYSDEDGMIRTGNNTDQQRQDSVVLYAPGKRRVARDVAQILGINTRPEAIDDDTLALANNTGSNASGLETDVVVVAGADQAS
jgi:LytR cell envelope-related transcriptional attenuator